MKRLLATAAGPLLDVAAFCVLISLGGSLRSSHIASFFLAITLNYLLKVRSTIVAANQPLDWRLHRQLLVAALMALFLRGGVLALLTQVWGWPAQVSILFAVAAGLAVMRCGYSYSLTPMDAAARWRMLAIGLVVYAFVLRLVYLGSTELLPEEAYYWNYSRHPAMGYLDHPPMVAWLIRLGTAAFGQTEFGVRVGALCCGAITSIFTYKLTRNLFGEACALAALVLAQTLPFFFLSGMLMTPDAPLTAAWAASLFFLERALVAGRADAWWRAGICLGLGMISKYSIGLLVPVTIGFMLWDPKSRQWWLRWEPYAAALIALAIFSPVIVWNAEHEWASFVFQTSRRLAEAPRFALHKLIASTLVLLTPTGVLAVALALTGKNSTSAGERDPTEATRRRRFVGLAILVPLAVFVSVSLRHEVKLDWTGALWTAALPIMALGMIAGGATLTGIRAWVRRAWVPTVVVMLLIYGAGLHYLVLGLPGLGYGKHIELTPVGWPDFSRQIAGLTAGIRKNSGEQPLIVGMDRYAIASELAFYGTKQAKTTVETSSSHLFGGVGLMYARWTPAEMQQGRTLLLVGWGPNDITGKNIESHVDRLGPPQDGVLSRDGRVIRHYAYRVAYGYHAIAHDPAIPRE
ncbi:MAG TPA: glycosyltransferase family 39 protein [Steroidobacteraceae bacterium]